MDSYTKTLYSSFERLVHWIRLRSLHPSFIS